MSRDRRPNGIRGDTRSNGVFLVASFEVTRARARGEGGEERRRLRILDYVRVLFLLLFTCTRRGRVGDGDGARVRVLRSRVFRITLPVIIRYGGILKILYGVRASESHGVRDVPQWQTYFTTTLITIIIIIVVVVIIRVI